MGNLKSQKSKTQKQKFRQRLKHQRRQVRFLLDLLLNVMADFKNHLNPLYKGADYQRDIATIQRRSDAEGLYFFTHALPQLSQGLFDLMEGRAANFGSFRRCRRRGYPRFLGGLFHLALHGAEEERVYAVDAIYNISVLFKKLRGPYKKSVLRKQYEDFVKVDSELGEIDLFTEDRIDILQTARSMVARLIQGASINSSAFVPRPGPGATNTPVLPYMRYRPHVAYAQLERVFPVWDGWQTSHPWDFVLESEHYTKLLKNVQPVLSSRFKFVPKTAGKARGICIEENEAQFLQQGMRRLLVKLISRSDMRGFVNFDDQGVNAKLALSSSHTKDYATIDMSEASDRIVRALVSWLFQDNPEIHNALMALSTRYIKPPQEASDYPILETQKFAPMGSAICFPVMSIVHYVLCRSISLHSSVPNNVADSKRIYVYGDDIVLPSSLYTPIIDWLPRFGMKLNTTKSFVKSRFRESCGIHAFDGVNITPCYIKHLPLSNSLAQLQSHFSVEYLLFKKGLTKAAAFLRRTVEDNFGLLPYVDPNSFIPGWKRSGACLLDAILRKGFKSRWNGDLQCREYRVACLTTGQKDYDMLQNDALLKWHCTKAEDAATVRDSDAVFTMKHRWVPESALKYMS